MNLDRNLIVVEVVMNLFMNSMKLFFLKEFVVFHLVIEVEHVKSHLLSKSKLKPDQLFQIIFCVGIIILIN